jgi:hypothetical protein
MAVIDHTLSQPDASGEESAGTMPNGHFTCTTQNEGGLASGASPTRELAERWAEGLRCTVRDKPLGPLASAVAVGALLGRLLRRG